MEGSYIELAEQLEGMGVKVGKFRADGDHKEFAKQKLQLVSFPTILFFPKHSSKPVKYPSEKRDVDSLMAFANALRWSVGIYLVPLVWLTQVIQGRESENIDMSSN